MRKRTLLAFVLCLISLILCLGVLNVLVTPKPFFCRSCHLEKNIYRAWTKSPHKEIDCVKCHREPGVLGYLVDQTKMAKRVCSFILSSYQLPLVSNIDNSSCLSCHQKISKKTVVKNAIRVRHKDFLEEGQACTDCHSAVGHQGTLKKQENPTMDKCTSCHNGKIASTKCKTCHVEKVKREVRYSRPGGIIHGKDWRQTHGMGNLTSCIICHSKTDCGRCHLEMPHDQNWPYYHGKKALNNDCLKCHVKSFCNDCHRIEMPHQASFLPKHSKTVEKKGDDVCYRCHIRDDCQRCHINHIHPGLGQPIPMPGRL